jgi:hypothetical protein
VSGRIFVGVSCPGRRRQNKCKDVNARAVTTAIPAPNDPLGRFVGSSTGNLKGAVSGEQARFWGRKQVPEKAHLATDAHGWTRMSLFSSIRVYLCASVAGLLGGVFHSLLSSTLSCAVKRRWFTVGESPTRGTGSFHPVAIGAAVEVTKLLKPPM